MAQIHVSGSKIRVIFMFSEKYLVVFVEVFGNMAVSEFIADYKRLIVPLFRFKRRLGESLR